ncbi:MAG: hypothetical protein Ct9H300mP15_08990 [Gemmatimonadota bacterium]|nr:MAG: hypothetical protein Ct9H300mP15_08990 [Gemmatimonadota bacterium]
MDLGIGASPEATEVLEDLGELESDEEKITETDSALDENEGSQVSEAIEGEIEVQDRSAPEKRSPLESAREGGPVRKIRQPTPSPFAPAPSAGPGGQVRIQAEGYTPDGRRQRKEKKKGKKRQRVDKDAVQSNIQRVMAEIKGGSGKKRRKKKGRQTVEEQEAQVEQERQEEERERKTRSGK